MNFYIIQKLWNKISQIHVICFCYLWGKLIFWDNTQILTWFDDMFDCKCHVALRFGNIHNLVFWNIIRIILKLYYLMSPIKYILRCYKLLTWGSSSNKSEILPRWWHRHVTISPFLLALMQSSVFHKLKKKLC